MAKAKENGKTEGPKTFSVQADINGVWVDVEHFNNADDANDHVEIRKQNNQECRVVERDA